MTELPVSDLYRKLLPSDLIKKFYFLNELGDR
jgi:hypothetical protein